VLIESKNIGDLRQIDLRIGHRLFVVAIDVERRKPLTVRVATTSNGATLYALPRGMGRATEREIRDLIKQGAL